MKEGKQRRAYWSHSRVLLAQNITSTSLDVIGLLYMAYSDGCWHKFAFLPRLRPLPREGASSCDNVTSLRMTLSASVVDIAMPSQLSYVILH